MIKYFNNKQVNLNVNVNNYNTTSEEMITKLNHISGNVETLNSNVSNIISGNYFDKKFEEKFSVDDYEKLLNLINNEQYNALTGYINVYDNFNSFMNILKNVDNTLMNYKINECEVQFPAPPASQNKVALINGIPPIDIKDINNNDEDEDTAYEFGISGFVLRIEIYTSATSNFTEVFVAKLYYDSQTGVTTIYLTEDDYSYIFGLEPNNKLKIVYLSKV